MVGVEGLAENRFGLPSDRHVQRLVVVAEVELREMGGIAAWFGAFTVQSPVHVQDHP